MKEPVDHIIRPTLPWRSEAEPAITECGYDASKVNALTRAEFFQRLKEYGKQRMAMVTCMTCSQTASRWPTWQEDPRHALSREIEWESPWYGREKRGNRLKTELLAIAQLIEQHPQMFNALVMAMDDMQKWRDKKVTRS